MLNILQNCRLGWWSSLVVLPTILGTTITNAQNLPSGAGTTTVPNIGNFNSGSLNQVQPIRQGGSTLDSSRNSRQFFNQGREQLFFLPDNDSESILKIDEELEGTEQKNQESTEELEPD